MTVTLLRVIRHSTGFIRLPDCDKHALHMFARGALYLQFIILFNVPRPSPLSLREGSHATV